MTKIPEKNEKETKKSFVLPEVPKEEVTPLKVMIAQTAYLKVIATELTSIRLELKKSNDLYNRAIEVKQSDLDKVEPEPAETEEDIVTKVRMLFPKELEEMLNFSIDEQHVIIKPKQFLGSENFAKIASVVRDAGGEYISAGKDSHLRILISKIGS